MPLSLLHRIAATILGCVLFVIVLRLTHRKRLDTALSVWWMVAGLIIIFLAWCDKALRLVAVRMTLEVSSIILVGGILFLLFTCLHMSASITRLSQQIRQISQSIALNNAKKPDGNKHTESSNLKTEQNVKVNRISKAYLKTNNDLNE